MEVFAAISNAIFAKAGIKDDEMYPAMFEGMMRRMVHASVAGKLALGECVDTMVAEDVVARSLKLSKMRFDGGQPFELLLDSGGAINEVAEFDDE